LLEQRKKMVSMDKHSLSSMMTRRMLELWAFSVKMKLKMMMTKMKMQMMTIKVGGELK
jgi:hypothetical protein